MGQRFGRECTFAKHLKSRLHMLLTER